MPQLFASTYKQVVENMNKIADFDQLLVFIGDLTDFPFDSFNELAQIVKELQDKLINITEPGENGDVVNTENGFKVIGIHVNTSNSETNTLPNEYKQGITFEIKNTDVIGLKGKAGVSENYCLIMTAVQDSKLENETVIDGFTAFQFAYGTDGLVLYKRTATDDMSAWEEWTGQELGGEARQQFIQTEDNTQPGEHVQLAGEYWMETLS